MTMILAACSNVRLLTVGLGQRAAGTLAQSASEHCSHSEFPESSPHKSSTRRCMFFGSFAGRRLTATLLLAHKLCVHVHVTGGDTAGNLRGSVPASAHQAIC